MAVYVDEIRSYPSGEWCHMMADSSSELHTFAARLGLSRGWSHLHQGKTDILHYDLRPHTRTRALQMGAVEIRAKDYIARLRK